MAPSSTNSNSWSHFHDRLHKKLLAEPDLLPDGSNLLLAISGGQDSMAMLGLLGDLKRLHNWSIFIWHGNHCWHEKSSEIADQLQKWSEKNDYEFFSDHANSDQVNNESSARDWRYKMLCMCIQKLSESKVNCSNVLTGHTSSDRTETLLLNLARGTDIGGMCSLKQTRPLNEEIFKKRIKLIRPMFDFSRKETLEICSILNLPIWLDPSNNSKYLQRNKIRHDIIPLLEEMNPGCSLRIASLANRLEKYKEDQTDLASLALKAAFHPEGLSRKIFFNISNSSRATIFSLWLKKNQVPCPSSEQLLNIARRIGQKKSPGSISLAQGWIIKWDQNIIKLNKNK